MDINKLKEKLKEYSKKDIITTNHAKIQAFVRGIDIEEVKENIAGKISLCKRTQDKES